MRTATLLIVATFNENMFPSVCVEAVEKLGKLDYLCTNNKMSRLSACMVMFRCGIHIRQYWSYNIK